MRANVSHMQSKWPVFGNGPLKVEMLEAARARGVDLSCDYEIYNMNSATLGSFLQIYHYTPAQLVGHAAVGGRAGGAEADDARDRPAAPAGPLRAGRGGRQRAWDRVIVWGCPHDRRSKGSRSPPSPPSGASIRRTPCST